MNGKLSDLSINKAAGISGTTLIALVFSIMTHMEKFATKQDVQISSLTVRIQLLKTRATDFEYIIASGRELTPIEQNTYNKLNDDIRQLTIERSKIINEN